MPRTTTDNVVSSGARHLYLALKDFARGKNWPECWPHLWRICENIKKSRRMVLYYLAELESFGAIRRIRQSGTGGRYRLLLDLNEKIGEWIPIAPVQPIAPVEICSIIEEDTTAASRAVVETPALAAEGNIKGEVMVVSSKKTLEELLRMGLPESAEIKNLIALKPDLAKEVLRHCKRRFAPGRRAVNNKGGYISALLRDPSKFGWLLTGAEWRDPEKPAGPTAEEVASGIARNKAATIGLLAKSQADAEKAYADMKASWDLLPEEAKAEIRVFVLQESPLFHASGADAQEFELQCMREATSPGRENWKRRRLGLPLLNKAWASKRG